MAGPKLRQLTSRNFPTPVKVVLYLPPSGRNSSCKVMAPQSHPNLVRRVSLVLWSRKCHQSKCRLNVPFRLLKTPLAYLALCSRNTERDRHKAIGIDRVCNCVIGLQTPESNATILSDVTGALREHYAGVILLATIAFQ